jgi:hypothetical protein
MSDPTIVARHFIQSIAAGEFAAARSYLDDHVVFEGPFDSFDNAEAYLAALRRLHPIVAGVEIRKVFADGDDVCVLYDLKTSGAAGSAFVCEWMAFRHGKIARVRAVFDARPFAAMFAPS